MPKTQKKRLPEGPFYRDLGRNIRFTRSAAGKSQEDTAEHLDISFQQLQKYENGTNRIPVDRLVSLASFLDVPVSQFVGESEAANSQTLSLMSQFESKECQNLLRYFLSIDDERVRAAVLSFVKSMAALSD